MSIYITLILQRIYLLFFYLLRFYIIVVYRRRRRLKWCNDPEKRSPRPVQRPADAVPTCFYSGARAPDHFGWSYII